MRCTIPALVANAPADTKSCITFSTLKQAFSFLEKRPEGSAKLRKSVYGADPRDTRYTVNFVGNRRPARVRTTPKRVIMTAGIVVDRLLPVVRA